MAAIDKLYVHSYYEYDDLRKWAIAYYPELLFYFYNFDLTYEEYCKNKAQWLANEKAIIQKEYNKIGCPFETLVDSVSLLIKHYKDTANYDCTVEQATDEVDYIMDKYADMVNGTLEDDYSFPAVNTPYKIDMKLLWICPVPCVREYLEKQCGYKTRWYHRFFWRGRKHFK